jgi:hypothetical protein
MTYSEHSESGFVRKVQRTLDSGGIIRWVFRGNPQKVAKRHLHQPEEPHHETHAEKQPRLARTGSII